MRRGPKGRSSSQQGKPARRRERLLPAALLGDAAARASLARRLLAPSRLRGDPPRPRAPRRDAPRPLRRRRRLPAPPARPRPRTPSRSSATRAGSTPLLGCLVAARLAEDADAGPAALEAADALDRKVPRDFLLDLAPRTVRRGLAPRPFDRLVAQTAAELGVPRDLLYAVMRQESRFDREAASPAAARGLMQLTLPAAGEAARELNEEPPAYAELYDPARSIRLGAQTLRSLLDRFGDDAALAASGYNAGAGQTVLWSGGSDRPAEALLAAISYAETRTYVRRVLANRRAYRLALPRRGVDRRTPVDEDPRLRAEPLRPLPHLLVEEALAQELADLVLHFGERRERLDAARGGLRRGTARRRRPASPRPSPSPSAGASRGRSSRGRSRAGSSPRTSSRLVRRPLEHAVERLARPRLVARRQLVELRVHLGRVGLEARQEPQLLLAQQLDDAQVEEPVAVGELGLPFPPRQEADRRQAGDLALEDDLVPDDRRDPVERHRGAGRRRRRALSRRRPRPARERGEGRRRGSPSARSYDARPARGGPAARRPAPAGPAGSIRE